MPTSARIRQTNRKIHSHPFEKRTFRADEGIGPYDQNPDFAVLPQRRKKTAPQTGAVFCFGAGYGNRTRLCGLGSDHSTDELTLHCRYYNRSQRKNQCLFCRRQDNCVSKHCVNRRGGASRSESKSNDCRWQSHNNSIGYQPPENYRKGVPPLYVYPRTESQKEAV